MSAATLTVIPTADVVASPDQNRTVFDPVKLRELADSIAEAGLRQPIQVRREVDLSGERYVLVAGERRLRACRDLLGWETVEAIVTDEEHGLSAALGTLAENMIRENPDPIDEARGLRSTCDRYGLEPAELAAKLGKSGRWVRDRLALLELADDVAHFVQSGGLPIGRAVLMAALDVNRQRLALQAHERGLGIDAFRALVARLADEQSVDAMFDTDSFLRVEEYVAEAESLAEAKESPVIQVRESPLGVTEIAQLLEVQRKTVETWRHRRIFPEPDLTVSGTPLWWETTVLEWAEQTGRRR